MNVIAAAAFAMTVCAHAARQARTDNMQQDDFARNENIGPDVDKLLSKLVNIILGFVDVEQLGISLQQFACVKTDEIVSEIYGGRVLSVNSNIIDVECSTNHVHIANPLHFIKDEPFNSETLFEVDNLALHLQCNLNIFTKYAKFLAGSKWDSMFGKKADEEPVWTGGAICDIKEVKIENPQVSVETLNKGTLFEGSLLRRHSNVDQFLRKAKDAFGGQEAPEEILEGDPEEVEPVTEHEASDLITWTSMQNPVTKTASSCFANPYTQKGEFVKHEGLCGFVLPRLELSIDGLPVVWKQAHTKAVAKLMSLSQKFTLTKILVYIIKYAGVLAGPAGGAINAVVGGMNSIGRQLDRLNPFKAK